MPVSVIAMTAGLGAGLDGVVAVAHTEGGGKRVAIDPGLQPRPEPASRRRVDHVPGLGLPLVGRSQSGSPSVVGMDLHGEIAAGVEELEQERVDAKPGVAAEHPSPLVPHQIAKRAAGERPCRHDALIAVTVDHLPRLGEILTWREFAAEER